MILSLNVSVPHKSKREVDNNFQNAMEFDTNHFDGAQCFSRYN